MALNLNIRQRPYDDLTALEQQEIIDRQAGSNVPLSHYINAGTQPRGRTEDEKRRGVNPPVDGRSQEQMQADINSSREEARSPMAVNPGGLPPKVSSFSEGLMTDLYAGVNGNYSLSPASLHAMQQQGIVPITGGASYVDNNTLEAPRGNVSDFANRTPQELIGEGFIPVGTGGVQRQVTKEYETDSLGNKSFVGTRGTYVEMTEKEAKHQIENIQRSSSKLGQFLGIAQESEDQVLRQALQQEFGDAIYDPETGSVSKELSLNFLLAYYSAMEESSYADFSGKEKRNHTSYKEEYGELHPDLWEQRDGRDARSPELAVLEDGIGKALEDNSGIKLKHKYNRDIIGQGILRAMGAVEGEKSMASIGMQMVDPKGDGVAYPYFYMSQDVSRKRDLLNATKGLRSLLNPGKRNNVRLTKRLHLRDITSELYGPRQSGVDPIRANAMNIQEGTAMRIDQGMLRILNRTFHASQELNDFWMGNHMKVKETAFNIVNQQDSYINTNGTNGVYYSDQKYRGSGRKGDENLMMADFKVVRALSIADKAGDHTFVKFGSDTEKAFKVGIMFLLGQDTEVEIENIKNFNNMFGNPTSDGRAWAADLEALADENISEEGLNAVLAKFQGVNLESFRDKYMGEGTDSIQALRAVHKYYTAKDKGLVSGFITTLIGEVDASQSGQTIQAYQIGDFLGALRGGTITGNWTDSKENNYNNLLDRKTKGLLNSVPKLYRATNKIALARFTGRAGETDRTLIARAFFGDDQGNYEENMFQDRFAKTGVQGASYGQMKDGAIQAIREDMIDWFEGLDSKQILHRTRALQSAFQTPFATLQDMLESNGDLMKLLNEVAEDYYSGMDEASNGQLEVYSTAMRDAFKAMTNMEALHDDLGEGFSEPKMTYKTPSDVNDPYGSPWKDGMSTTMIDKVANGDWLRADFSSGIDSEIDFRSISPITYNKNPDFTDIQGEKEKQTWQDDQRKYLNKNNSTAITRFPVISIHGLDDLVMSIAISELDRELRKNGGKGLQYIMSVWDAGRVPVLLRDKFAKHYNKAFTKVMKENSFFEMLYRGLDVSLKEAQGKMTLVISRNKVTELENMEKAVRKMKTTMENFEGVAMNREGNMMRTGGGRASFFGNTIAQQHVDSGMQQPFDSIVSSTRLTQAERLAKRQANLAKRNANPNTW